METGHYKRVIFPLGGKKTIKGVKQTHKCRIHILQPHSSNRNSRKKCESAVRMQSPVTASSGAPSPNTS